VLHSGDASDPAALVGGWIASRADAVKRYRELVDDVRAGAARDPSAQAVVVREVAELAG
jgi:hypothetical protein